MKKMKWSTIGAMVRMMNIITAIMMSVIMILMVAVETKVMINITDEKDNYLSKNTHITSAAKSHYHTVTK